VAYFIEALMHAPLPQPAAPRAILVEGIGKKFQSGGSSVEAVRNLSLQVDTGELFGLFGHNGAGKSTLVRMLATLVRPTYGRAQINGFDLVRAEQQVRASIGLVASDERSFYGRLSGRDNLRFFATLQNVRRAHVEDRVAYSLRLFDLGNIAQRPFQTYSTGQRQRLNMARAILHDPPILFLDEPTKSMDVQTADFVKSLVKLELVGRQHKTVVFISHELYEMENFCDRVAVVNRGELRALGTPAELMRSVPTRPLYELKLNGPAALLVRAMQAMTFFEGIADTSDLEGRSTIRFHLCSSPEPQTGAGSWQSLLWQAVAACAAKVDSFQQVDGHSLRDVIRYYSEVR
jgi:ABC-2 type transport system ATP-binding protein